MTFKFPVRVYYEDTDFSGIVYHARYLHFAERARTEALRACSISHTELLSRVEPLVFAIRNMNCDWESPARIDDELEVRTDFVTIKGARMHLQQSIWRGEDLLFSASVEAVCMSATGRPRRVPGDVMDLIFS